MKNRLFLIYISSLFIVLGCSNSVKKDTIIIATAANMHFVMQELVQEFTNVHSINCDLVVSSSGKLTAQLIEGAPYDIMVSADMKYPTLLYSKGISIMPPKVYAKGKLVLWTNLPHITTVEQITESNIEHIALANPKTAPYGRAAEEVLKYYHTYDTLASKFVFGESISQTNQFVMSGVAQVGFTAKSVVLSPNLKHKGNWVDINPLAYSPIEQGIIVLKQNETKNQSAMKFYNFMFSNKAKEILVKFGYEVGE